MGALFLLLGVLFLALAVYGAAKTWEAVAKFAHAHQSKATALGVALTLGVMSVMPGAGVFAQSTTITLDMQPFFDSLNNYLPTFVQIFGLIGGIAAAIGFARFIIGSVVNALRGGSV